MARLGQFRRDTLANWQTNNPVLADGEFALVAKNPNDPQKYNAWVCGDGVTQFTGLFMFSLQDNIIVIQEVQQGNTTQVPSSDAVYLESFYVGSFVNFDAADDRNAILGKYIASDGVSLVNAASKSLTAFIAVSPGEQWLFTGRSTNPWCHLWGYSDKNKSTPTELLPSPNQDFDNYLVTIPAGIYFIQGWFDNNVNFHSLVRKNNLQNQVNTLSTLVNNNKTRLDNDEPRLQKIDIGTIYNANEELIPEAFIIGDGTSIAHSEGYSVMKMTPVNKGEIWLFTAYQGASLCNLWGYSDENRSNPTQLLSEPFYQVTRTNEEITIPEGINYIQGYGMTLGNRALSLFKKGSVIDINKDLNEINKDLVEIEYDLNEIKKVSDINYFVPFAEYQGYYITPSGTLGGNSNWCLSEYIQVTPGQQFFYKGSCNAGGLSICWGYSGQNRENPIALVSAGTGEWTDLIITIPSGVNYIQAQSLKSADPYFKLVLEKDIINHTLEFNTGSGSFRDFLATNVINPSAKNRYTIYIGPGNYNLTNEITQEEIEGDTFIGITVPNYTTLIGTAGPENTVFYLNITSGKISTLNLMKTCSLIGLHIIGENCRYAIHDDFSTPNDGTERLIENCIVEGINLSYSWAYGAGCKSGQRYVYRNCIFKGPAGFEMHTNKNFTRASYFELENCICIAYNTSNPWRALELRGLAGLDSQTPVLNPIMNYATIKGCKTSGINLLCVADSDFDININIIDTELENEIHKENTTYSPNMISNNIKWYQNKPYWWNGSNWVDAQGSILQ